MTGHNRLWVTDCWLGWCKIGPGWLVRAVWAPARFENVRFWASPRRRPRTALQAALMFWSQDTHLAAARRRGLPGGPRSTRAARSSPLGAAAAAAKAPRSPPPPQQPSLREEDLRPGAPAQARGVREPPQDGVRIAGFAR